MKIQLFLEDCGDTLVEKTIDEKNTNELVMDYEKSETFIKTETFDDDVVEIKPIGNLAVTSSYVVQKKTKVDEKKLKNVKARQLAAVKSVVERPKTARERTKVSVNSIDWKPHTPGALPSYYRKQKENTLKKSTTFQVEMPSAKNSTANVGDTIIHSKMKEHGDMIKSSTSTPSVEDDNSQEIEKIKAQNSSQKSKLMSMRTEIIDLRLKNDSLEKQLNEVMTARDKSDNEFKMGLDKIKSLEAKLGRNLIEIRAKDERLEKFEVEIANLIKQKQDMSSQLMARIEENQKLEKRMEKLKKELNMKSTSYDTVMSEKKHMEGLLEQKQENEAEGSNNMLNFMIDVWYLMLWAFNCYLV